MRFPASADGNLDLRLREPKKVSCSFELGKPLTPDTFVFKPLEPAQAPQVDYSGVQTPWHLTRTILSHIPRAQSANSVALDLGCGSGLHRHICEHAGFNWLGIDYNTREAPILGDGHALPIADNGVEFVLSMAVLEHIRFPFVVAGEVYRVLEPGGLYIGTVSFLEPFHGDSYYHHTHLGTYNTLSSAGFEVLAVGPNVTWSGLRAQATMGGLFPRMPAPLAISAVWPLEMLHKAWWRLGRLVSPSKTDTVRLLINTGSFEFIARKPKAA
jgi:SAM-dependent methyltransferase